MTKGGGCFYFHLSSDIENATTVQLVKRNELEKRFLLRIIWII